MIKISMPLLDEKEERAVIEVLRSEQLAQGEKVSLFEQKFAQFIGTKYAIATSSGTTALHLALLALGIRKGDEIITTPFSFIASTTSILFTGAKPVFVDIDPNTFNIDTNLIEKRINPKTRAILPVHLFGLPANMEKIIKIAKKYHLFVLEDAAQAHGAKIGNQRVGNFGDLGAFSFYPTKNMTTGEGGMVTTNNEKLADKIKLLRSHGMKMKYHNDVLGFNFRMTEIEAAIGLEQLKKLPTFNNSRINNAEFLNVQLADIYEIVIPFIPKGYTHVFHQYTILVKEGNRDELAGYLGQNGVETAIYYPIPIHRQKFIQKIYPKLHLENVERVANQALSIPVHASVKKEDLEKIISLIKKFFQRRS